MIFRIRQPYSPPSSVCEISLPIVDCCRMRVLYVTLGQDRLALCFSLLYSRLLSYHPPTHPETTSLLFRQLPQFHSPLPLAKLPALENQSISRFLQKKDSVCSDSSCRKLALIFCCSYGVNFRIFWVKKFSRALSSLLASPLFASCVWTVPIRQSQQ